jgi:hypothetical protein
MKTRISLLGGLALAMLAASLPPATAQQQPKPSPARSDHEPTIASPIAVEPNEGLPEKAAPATITLSKGQGLPPGAYVSPWLMDVIKLAQARINETILLAFIDSAGTFNIDADQIIYLRDLGVSGEVITTMLEHDFEIVSGVRPVPAAASASPPTVHLTFVRSDSAGQGAISNAVSPARASSSAAGPVAAVAAFSPGVSEDERQVDSYEPSAENSNELDIGAPRALTEESQALPLRQTISPVRKPYAVELIDPIIMIRGVERTPNLVVIELMR